MERQINDGKDVVGFLIGQHEQVKGLFDVVLAQHGEERAAAFADLRRLMAIHEVAEEEVVHPAARRALPNGDGVVAARLREEHTAKRALAALERMDVDSAGFEAQLKVLRAGVLAHAALEEKEEFARLPEKIDEGRLQRMRSAVEIAEKLAPTHPHAGIESSAANLIAGPFAAMIDRARDAVAKKN